MDDYYRPMLESDVPHARKGKMPSDIIRRDIDLEGKLAERAQHRTGKKRHLPRLRVETINDLRLAHTRRHAQQPLRLVDHAQKIQIVGRRDRIEDTTAIGIAVVGCGRGVVLEPDAQQTRDLQTTEIAQQKKEIGRTGGAR
jgi:hypothetical protein